MQEKALYPIVFDIKDLKNPVLQITKNDELKNFEQNGSDMLYLRRCFAEYAILGLEADVFACIHISMYQQIARDSCAVARKPIC